MKYYVMAGGITTLLLASSSLAVAQPLSDVAGGMLPKSYKQLVDAAVATQLKDPESRKVDFYSTPYGGLVCGAVNAKNPMGGYVGRQPFYAVFDTAGRISEVEIFSPNDVAINDQNYRSGNHTPKWDRMHQLLIDCNHIGR